MPTLDEIVALRADARRLDWAAHRSMRASRSGTRLSRFRGRGVDFAEVRAYEPGDDVRHIDWRVTARTGRTHTKLFQEERERPVLVVADLGPSSFFGTRRRMKSVAVTELAALLLWRAFDEGDRIGAIIRDCNDHHAFRPRHSQQTLLRILGRLQQGCTELAERLGAQAPQQAPPPAQGFRLTDALAHAHRVARPGSRVLVISDFADADMLDGDGDVARHLQRLGRRSELEVLHVSDPFDRALPAADIYALSDGSNRLLLDTAPATTRAAWRRRHAARMTQLQALVRGARGQLMSFGTEDDLAHSLGETLRRQPLRRGSTAR